MGILRKTKSIELLLNEFNNKAGAISVIQLIEKLSSQLNKTTIYRVLDKLEDDGVLHSFLGEKGIKWFAQCTGCSKSEHNDMHPHFQCTDCGTIDCVDVVMPVPNIPNRKVIKSQILIQGICDKCFTA